jgi:hypothetical protein
MIADKIRTPIKQAQAVKTVVENSMKIIDAMENGQLRRIP